MLTTSGFPLAQPLFEVPADAKSHGAVVPVWTMISRGAIQEARSTGTKCLRLKLTSLESGSES
jgi:hypothetical protein